MFSLCQCTTPPTGLYSFERRHCSAFSDESVQLRTAKVFNDADVFSKVKEVAKMLKAIHAQEDKAAALEKAKAVAEKLRQMKLTRAAQKIEESVAETLTYMDFPSEHWTRIRTNNVLERINREIKRRTKVVGTFPDGESALMLVCARLRHITGSVWGSKRYLNMEHLHSMEKEQEIVKIS